MFKRFKIGKTIKHDKYQQALCKQIQPHYDFLYTNVPLYSKRKRVVAEIDVLACKDGICDIFEVKCSHRITKAKKQLNKIGKLLGNQTTIRGLYFFCGATGELTII